MKVLKKRTQIAKKVQDLAKTIASDYKNKELVLLGVLNGSYMFLSDLSKALWRFGLRDFEIDFIGISSYGSKKESSRRPKSTKQPSLTLKGKHVLIVEDIIETGRSLLFAKQMLKKALPASVKSIVLLEKKGKKEVNVKADYIGFTVSSTLWVEGYGLDTDNKNRGCPDILTKN